eukprot:scaffold17315_cov70-Isochrysis_galbana.AAC.1
MLAATAARPLEPFRCAALCSGHTPRHDLRSLRRRDGWLHRRRSRRRRRTHVAEAGRPEKACWAQLPVTMPVEARKTKPRSEKNKTSKREKQNLEARKTKLRREKNKTSRPPCSRRLRRTCRPTRSIRSGSDSRAGEETRRVDRRSCGDEWTRCRRRMLRRRRGGKG